MWFFVVYLPLSGWLCFDGFGTRFHLADGLVLGVFTSDVREMCRRVSYIIGDPVELLLAVSAIIIISAGRVFDKEGMQQQQTASKVLQSCLKQRKRQPSSLEVVCTSI